jgi:STAS domain
MSTYGTPFAIRVASIRDGSVRVRVERELDLSTAPQLDQALRREIMAGNKVVVDLSGIAFIDSSGLVVPAPGLAENPGGQDVPQTTPRYCTRSVV